MKIQILIITLITSTFIVVSCGLPAPDTTAITFPSVQQITSAVSGSDSSFDDVEGYSLVTIQGRSRNNKYFFQKTFDSRSNKVEDLVFELPNDKWVFYGIGWMYDSEGEGNGLNETHCFVSEEVELEGIEKDQSILISESECSNFQRGTSEDVPEVEIVNYTTDDSGNLRYGSDQSIKVSILDISLAKMEVLNLQASYISKKTLWNTIDSNPCLSFSNAPKLKLPIPFNQSQPRPVYLLIEGFLDSECKVPNIRTKIQTVTSSGNTATVHVESKELILNILLGENYESSSSPLNLARSGINTSRVDGDINQLIWLTTRKDVGEVCAMNENCISGNCIIRGSRDAGICRSKDEESEIDASGSEEPASDSQRSASSSSGG